MSLLIKALDKAQAEKAKADKLTPTLTPDEKRAATAGHKSPSPPSMFTEQLQAELAQNVAPDLSLTASPPAPASASEAQVDAASLLTLETLEADKTPPRKSQSPSAADIKPASTNPQPVSVEAAKAANLFTAKTQPSFFTRNRWFYMVGLACAAGIGLLVYYYLMINRLQQPTGFPSPVAPIATHSPDASAPASVAPTPAPSNGATVTAPLAVPKPLSADQSTTDGASTAGEASSKDTDAQHQLLFRPSPRSDDADSALTADKAVAQAQVISKTKSAKAQDAIASESASITVTQSKAVKTVNPQLLQAYDAYNAGRDDESNHLYKQVLRQDSLNVDALLGLGAIAQRQNRLADADGWYRKVLEIDPRNTYARAALIQLPNAQNNNPADEESRLKSMLALSPEDANLYAALGHLYAEQKRWSEAQQAYFEAHRLHASADNAFNLAISLDQLGKANLALPYYEEALGKSSTAQPSNINIKALTARINAIK